MSTSYNCGVILGVTASDLGLKIEKSLIPYEIHDKKGKPTGKFGKEETAKITYLDKERIENDLYFEYIEELITVKKPLKIFNLDYEDIDPESILIGIEVVNNGYNDWNVIKKIDLSENPVIKEEIKKQFGLDIEPELYFYFNVS